MRSNRSGADVARVRDVSERPVNVLFLCTGNSARSILAEALLDHLGRGRFKGYSAGSFPKGAVNPLSLDVLRKVGLPVEGLRSKSWDEFARPGAPAMDLVITVCDQAAGETCPVWPGQPVTAHWGMPDPAAADGPYAQRLAAFERTLTGLEARIRLLTALPLASMERLAIAGKVAPIGRTQEAP